MHSLPRSSLNPFQMIYANILQNVLFSKYFCANINSLCTLSLGPLSTFSSCFMAICYKIFLCANIVPQISNYHLSLNPRAFFQLFPGAFCEYFTKYVCANIVLQILINYALNPTAISQLLYANILQTRSYAALRAGHLHWIVEPGYSWGGYTLGCSQRLASCLWHSARIGPDTFRY